MTDIVKVLVSKEARKFPLADEILSRVSPYAEVQFIEDIEQEKAKLVFEDVDILSKSKKILYLTVFKGEFIKPCPCTKGVVCCRYYFLNGQTGCSLDCSYCILQDYLNMPFLTVYVNISDMFASLDSFLKQNKHLIRIGTGELTDSLSIDSITKLSSYLVPYFSDKENVLFELKTKSSEIENLLKIPGHGNRTVISWSLSPDLWSRENERAASIAARLHAAALCGKYGYPLGFHLDPIVQFPGWKREYKNLIKALFNSVESSWVSWISMGSLRFSPSMTPIIKKRFPTSRITVGELHASFDGKMRYLFSVRADMYIFILGCIREFGGDVPTYLCMENGAMWQETGLTMPW